MPLPMVNMISGGLHAGGNLDFQDFLLMPVGRTSYSAAAGDDRRASTGSSARLLARARLRGRAGRRRGRLRPEAPQQRAGRAVPDARRSTEAGFDPGRDAAIALDVASTHFYGDGQLSSRRPAAHRADADDRTSVRAGWTAIPSSASRTAWPRTTGTAGKRLTAALGERVQLIGDDLFVTNPERCGAASTRGVANSVLVKLNQIGTLTETLEVIGLRASAGYRPVISARSGETEDTTIADLAVGDRGGADQDRLRRPQRAAGEVQSAPAHRGSAGPDAPFAGRSPLAGK